MKDAVESIVEAKFKQVQREADGFMMDDYGTNDYINAGMKKACDALQKK